MKYPDILKNNFVNLEEADTLLKKGISKEKGSK